MRGLGTARITRCDDIEFPPESDVNTSRNARFTRREENESPPKEECLASSREYEIRPTKTWNETVDGGLKTCQNALVQHHHALYKKMYPSVSIKHWERGLGCDRDLNNLIKSAGCHILRAILTKTNTII